MEYEDRLTITTPEGVELELQLAGLGSRFIAQMLDLLIKGLAILLVVITLSALGLTGVAIMIPAVLLILYAYDVVFETFSNGRTPGKRALRLRVVRVGGEPVDFMSSAIRNVLRLIEGIPTSYIPGMVSILATKRNQRLGDLAAGTIVIHEEAVPAPKPGPPPRLVGAPGWGPPTPPPSGGVWDVSSVGPEELAAVRSFLERRWTLESPARGQLAVQLADALWPKVAGAPANLPPETFLEQLVQQKSGRG
ncbi:MAG TPA: RDD family protein [Thermoleophilaceae bacterium]